MSQYTIKTADKEEPIEADTMQTNEDKRTFEFYRDGRLIKSVKMENAVRVLKNVSFVDPHSV